jgi:hypothetical protein
MNIKNILNENIKKKFSISSNTSNILTNFILGLILGLLLYICYRIYKFLNNNKEGFEDGKLVDLLDKLNSNDFKKDSIWDNNLYNQQSMSLKEPIISFWNPKTYIKDKVNSEYKLLGSCVNTRYNEPRDKTLLVNGNIKYPVDVQKIFEFPHNIITNELSNTIEDTEGNYKILLNDLLNSINNKEDIENILEYLNNTKNTISIKINEKISDINSLNLKDLVGYNFKVYTDDGYFKNKLFDKQLDLNEEITYSKPDNTNIYSFSVPYGSIVTLNFADGSSKVIDLKYENVIDNNEKIEENDNIEYLKVKEKTYLDYSTLLNGTNLEKNEFNIFGENGLGFYKVDSSDYYTLNRSIKNGKPEYAYNYMVGIDNIGLSGAGKKNIFDYLNSRVGKNKPSLNDNDILYLYSIKGDNETSDSKYMILGYGDNFPDGTNFSASGKGYRNITDLYKYSNQYPFFMTEKREIADRKNLRKNKYTRPYDSYYNQCLNSVKRYNRYYGNTGQDEKRFIHMPNVEKLSNKIDTELLDITELEQDLKNIFNNLYNITSYNFTNLNITNYINNETFPEKHVDYDNIENIYLNLATKLPIYYNWTKKHLMNRYYGNCCDIRQGNPNSDDEELYRYLSSFKSDLISITVKMNISEDQIHILDIKKKYVKSLNLIQSKLVGENGDLTKLINKFNEILEQLISNNFEHYTMKIYRSIPPEKYKTVGDIIYKWDDINYSANKFSNFDLNLLPICIPEQCVKEVRNWLPVDKVYEYNKNGKYLAIFRNPYLQTFKAVTIRDTLPEGKVEKIVACVEGCKIIDQIIESDKCANNFYKNNRNIVNNNNLDSSSDVLEHQSNIYQNEIIKKQQQIDNLKNMAQLISKEDETANIINREHNRAKLQQTVDNQTKNLSTITKKFKNEHNNIDINLNFSYNKFQKFMYNLVQNQNIPVPVYNNITKIVKEEAKQELKKQTSENRVALGLEKETAKQILSKCPTIDTKNMVLRSLLESGCNCFFTDEELANL